MGVIDLRAGTVLAARLLELLAEDLLQPGQSVADLALPLVLLPQNHPDPPSLGRGWRLGFLDFSADSSVFPGPGAAHAQTHAHRLAAIDRG